MKGYLGIDIGSISTKGVVIDAENNILAKEYLWTEGDPSELIDAWGNKCENGAIKRA